MVALIDEKMAGSRPKTRDAGLKPVMKGCLIVSQIGVFMVIVLFLVLHVFNILSQDSLHLLSTPKNDTFHAPKKNVWADLESAEVVDLLKFMHAAPNPLNLTAAENATAWDDHISIIEALRPNKTDVLRYIDGRSTSLPPRWARVTVDHGATPEPTVEEYMVGPLPVSDDTEIIPLEYCYNSGRSHTPNLVPDIETFVHWASPTLQQVSEITLDLLGGIISTPFNSSPDGLDARGHNIYYENGRRVAWVAIMGKGGKSGAWALLSQGLHVKIDITTRDTSNWRFLQWLYNGIFYDSLEEFREAWQSPHFEKVPPNRDGDWTATADFDHGMPERDLPPPIMIQPAALRYGLDREQSFVSWMGFEFYLAFDQITGITLYDIRFQGERIMYELGLQEALAHYAGDDPEQGPKAFLDTFFGMGALMFELVPGYDCPAYASYIDTKYHRDESTFEHKNSVCLFEYTSDHPLQRHTASSLISVSRNTYFVVRFISTVGNYDYTFDYIFYLDGSIEVKVRASGYISGAFWPSSTSLLAKRSASEYGYRVHDQMSTSIHDHVLNFKADLDVAGSTSNTLMRVSVEPTTKSYPWDSPSPESQKSRIRNTMRITHTPVEHETGLNWPPNAHSMYIIQSNASNAWGEKRGYAIRPGTGMGTPAHLTVLNSTAIGKAAEWASMDFWALKQHDIEPRSASPANALYLDEPLIDFSKFVDGENIEDEDLVIYFNLGTHHLPTSNDIPNTLTHTSASSVMFVPHNYFDRDPSRRSAQGVALELAQNGSHHVKYYGKGWSDYTGRTTKKEDGNGLGESGVWIDGAMLEPNLTKYHAAGHAVRKFPWNESVIAV